MSKVNPEGLTWAEWAYAAGIPEHILWIPPPHRNPAFQELKDPPPHRAEHGSPGYARFFRKERKAWNRGEDPTEYRACVPRKLQG